MREHILDAVGRHPDLAYDLARDLGTWVFLGPWHSCRVGLHRRRGWQGVRSFTLLVERRHSEPRTPSWDWGIQWDGGGVGFVRGTGHLVSGGPWANRGDAAGSAMEFLGRRSGRVVELETEPWEGEMSSRSVYESDQLAETRERILETQDRVFGGQGG